MKKGSVSNPYGPHLTESNFRRFESVFSDLLEKFPDPLEVHPVGLAPTTTVARLRDAANAFLIHKYASPIPLDTFQSLWSQVICRVCGSSVVISLPSADLSVLQVQNKPFDYAFTLLSPTAEQLLAAFSLILTSAITKPILVEGPLPDVDVPPTIFIQPQPNGTHLII